MQTTDRFANAISPSARKQGDRAARKIAREFAAHNLPTRRDGDVSEELRAASYDEAADRGVYQSDAYMEEWLDWRSYVENRVIEELTKVTADGTDGARRNEPGFAIAHPTPLTHRYRLR